MPLVALFDKKNPVSRYNFEVFRQITPEATSKTLLALKIPQKLGIKKPLRRLHSFKKEKLTNFVNWSRATTNQAFEAGQT